MYFFYRVGSFFLFFCLLTQLMAQVRRLDDAKEFIQSGKLEKAKEAITLALENDKTKNKVETWYLKGIIYNDIAIDTVLSQQYADAREIAFAAYKKAYELDAKEFNKFLVLYNSGVHPVMPIYGLYYRDAIAEYNMQNYILALHYFRKAYEVNSYLAALPNSERPQLDTSLVINSAAMAATYAQKIKERQPELSKLYLDTAAYYYGLLADAKVADTAYAGIYKWLCLHYYQENPDAHKLQKYLFLGKKIFPQDAFYPQLVFDMKFRELNKQNVGKDKIFELYEETIDSITDAAQKRDMIQNYISELFSYVHASGNKMDNRQELEDRLEGLYQELLEEFPQEPDIHFDLAKHYYYQFNNMSSVSSAPLKTKRNDLLNQKEFNDRALKKAQGAQRQKLTKKKADILKELAEVDMQLQSIEDKKMAKALQILEHTEFLYAQLDKKKASGTITRVDKNKFKDLLNVLITCSEFRRLRANVDKSKAIGKKEAAKAESYGRIAQEETDKIAKYEELYDALK